MSGVRNPKKPVLISVCHVAKQYPIVLMEKKALRLHGEDPNHKKNVKIVKTNKLLPGVYGQGHASVADRCAKLRAITSAFISENCLLFSFADRLIRYAQRMGKDKHALEKSFNIKNKCNLCC